ncbi:unnamed protein product [Cochlearia groenlandica]
MWMMGYNEGGGADSFNGGRKLRPLIPRLSSCPTASAANTNSDHRFNMALLTMTPEQQNKRELMMLNSSTEPIPQQHPPPPSLMVSSRWNPTADQLRVLEELYQQGTRTPSADHIQQITSQLRRYGKIEGKNVFYWFQNHKARERQKRRRQMENGYDESNVITTTTSSLVSSQRFDKKDHSCYKVDQTKDWLRSVGSVTQTEKPHDHIHHEEHVSIPMVSTKCNGRHMRNATWHMQQLPHGLYSSSSQQQQHNDNHHHHHHHHNHLILNSTSVSCNMTTCNNTVLSAKDTVTVSPLFMMKTRATMNTTKTTCDNKEEEQEQHEDQHQEQTLELFPLRKEGFCSNHDKDKESVTQCFYEFLPLKN